MLALFAATMLLAPPATAAPEKPSAGENLGDDLLGDWALPPATSVRPAAPLPGVDQSREQLQPPSRSAPAGEDLGQQGTSPLERISNRMYEAYQLISRQSIDGTTRKVQEAIVSDLDQLIEELSQQCKNCRSGQQGQQSQQQQTASSAPKPSSGEQSGPPSEAQASAQQSTIAPGGGKPTSLNELSDAELVKRLWGQLPQHMREQLLQSSADQFLPKYRAELEEYFRKLSEDEGGQGGAR